MYKPIITRLLIIMMILASGSYLTGQNKKLGQTGFQFLSVTSDARAAGMGGAMTTVEAYSASLFFNPAGMARVPNLLDVRFNQNEWIADIMHNSFSLSFRPGGGEYGVFGLSLLSVDYGDIQGTMVAENEQGYVETETFTPSALAVGIGYARALTDKFSVGAHLKSAHQSLGKSVIPVTDTTNTLIKNLARATAFDFGTIYFTGFKSLAFGMSVRNFSDEIKFESEGFQLPLTFRIGVSMDVLDLLPEKTFQSLLVSLDAVHPRSYPEYVDLGMEYTLAGMFAVRSGYLFNREEQGLTVGVGVQKRLKNIFFAVDYSSSPFGVFGNIQRLSLQFSL
ncbi:MAG: PorV/PorQ family protein [Candidatus Neomarinimicrobiota bacterium]